MARLNSEREKTLEPKRTEYAIAEINRTNIIFLFILFT